MSWWRWIEGENNRQKAAGPPVFLVPDFFHPSADMVWIGDGHPGFSKEAPCMPGTDRPYLPVSFIQVGCGKKRRVLHNRVQIRSNYHSAAALELNFYG